MTVQFPKPTEPFLDGSGRVTRWWYDYLRTLTSSAVLAEMQAQIAANAAAIAELQNAGGFSGNVVGIDSVFTYGQLADGTVWVTLQGDVLAPGATYYYGTGPDGAKGWFAVADALDAAADELTKTVDPATGVTTFGLADTAVTPGTYTNATVTVDEKGRVTFVASGAGGGGILPVVTGEIVSDQPVFVYLDDGSLVYAEVA